MYSIHVGAAVAWGIYPRGGGGCAWFITRSVLAQRRDVDPSTVTAMSLSRRTCHNCRLRNTCRLHPVMTSSNPAGRSSATIHHCALYAAHFNLIETTAHRRRYHQPRRPNLISFWLPCHVETQRAQRRLSLGTLASSLKIRFHYSDRPDLFLPTDLCHHQYTFDLQCSSAKYRSTATTFPPSSWAMFHLSLCQPRCFIIALYNCSDR
jgi:hypothetical protein